MHIESSTNYYSLGIIVFAAINLFMLMKRNAFMSAQNGLHVNLAIFYGLGPLANGFAVVRWDKLVMQTYPMYLNEVQQTLFFSYLICTLFTILLNRRQPVIYPEIDVALERSSINRLTSITLLLSIIGYLFASSDFATSGIGTLFPVLRNLLFPTLVMLIYNASANNRSSIILLIFGFILVGFNAFYSQWRSELIVFVFSIGAGLVLRNRRFLWAGIVIGPLLVILILPFQALKKFNKIDANENYADVFIKSIGSKDNNPFEMAINFAAFRINYGREAAYVVRGIDRGYIDYRYGESYLEMVYQLIPRVFWPDKPSYNYFSGYVLPRKVGLSSKFDFYTSWAVNYFAEFLYNFPLTYLPVFFLIYWMILGWFDRLSLKMKLMPELSVLLRFSLFFLVLNTVSLVNGATYFLWLFLIMKMINYFLKKRKRNLDRSYADSFIR